MLKNALSYWHDTTYELYYKSHIKIKNVYKASTWSNRSENPFWRRGSRCTGWLMLWGSEQCLMGSGSNFWFTIRLNLENWLDDHLWRKEKASKKNTSMLNLIIPKGSLFYVVLEEDGQMKRRKGYWKQSCEVCWAQKSSQDSTISKQENRVCVLMDERANKNMLSLGRPILQNDPCYHLLWF